MHEELDFFSQFIEEADDPISLYEIRSQIQNADKHTSSRILTYLKSIIKSKSNTYSHKEQVLKILKAGFDTLNPYFISEAAVIILSRLRSLLQRKHSQSEPFFEVLKLSLQEWADMFTPFASEFSQVYDYFSDKGIQFPHLQRGIEFIYIKETVQLKAAVFKEDWKLAKVAFENCRQHKEDLQVQINKLASQGVDITKLIDANEKITDALEEYKNKKIEATGVLSPSNYQLHRNVFASASVSAANNPHSNSNRLPNSLPDIPLFESEHVVSALQLSQNSGEIVLSPGEQSVQSHNIPIEYSLSHGEFPDAQKDLIAEDSYIARFSDVKIDLSPVNSSEFPLHSFEVYDGIRPDNPQSQEMLEDLNLKENELIGKLEASESENKALKECLEELATENVRLNEIVHNMHKRNKKLDKRNKKLESKLKKIELNNIQNDTSKKIDDSYSQSHHKKYNSLSLPELENLHSKETISLSPRKKSKKHRSKSKCAKPLDGFDIKQVIGREICNFRWWKKALCKEKSIIFENINIQVGIELKSKGDYFLFSIFIGNKSNIELNNLVTYIEDVNPGISVKIKTKKDSMPICSMESAHRLIAFKINDHFERCPVLVVTYNNCKHNILLPLTCLIPLKRGEHVPGLQSFKFSSVFKRNISLKKLICSINFYNRFEVSQFETNTVILSCEQARIILSYSKQTASFEVSSASHTLNSLLARLIYIQLSISKI